MPRDDREGHRGAKTESDEARVLPWAARATFDAALSLL